MKNRNPPQPASSLATLIPFGAKEIRFVYDRRAWPAQRTVVMKCEVSEDGGATWRYENGATIEPYLLGEDDVCSLGVAFIGGSVAPRYCVRSQAQAADGAIYYPSRALLLDGDGGPPRQVNPTR